jgi:hypothetical protein
MPKYNHQGRSQLFNRVFNRADNLCRAHVSCNPNNEKVAPGLIKHDFYRAARVRTGNNNSKWMLPEGRVRHALRGHGSFSSVAATEALITFDKPL